MGEVCQARLDYCIRQQPRTASATMVALIRSAQRASFQLRSGHRLLAASVVQARSKHTLPDLPYPYEVSGCRGSSH